MTRCQNTWFVALLLNLGFVAAVSAQLAITEVMSEASGAVVPQRPDFWELTNFGTNRIDLSPYRWIDSGGIDAADPRFFEGRSIGPGESIVLVRSNVTTTLTPLQFRDWWGNISLPSELQILFYRGPGLSQNYDAIQLWKVTDISTNLVDRVDFFSAVPGTTFTYDPQTGQFDRLSRSGFQGAFRAATELDVGSPGWTTGPVPLRVMEAPVSTEIDAGASATFSVRAYGLPKPSYQWCWNGQPIPGATKATFTITNALPTAAGSYTVELNNGLETLVSPAANLNVSTAFSCVRIVRAPANLEVTSGQDTSFSVEARGYPLPTYQWQFNGVSLLGATNPTLTIQTATFELTGTYSVQVTNSLCSTSVQATLRVSLPPDLRVTEVMAATSTNTTAGNHQDWWELTNFGTNAVSLRGYRFDDAPGVLTGAVVITNDVIVKPGESVVLISDMTREEFVSWWGEENLPGRLQIIAYAGNSFDSLGDALYLWNATATARDDVITSLSFVGDTRGVSLWFDSALAEFGELSVAGGRGAFQSVEADDVGSPGWITNPPPRVIPPKILSVQHNATGITLTWRTQAGQTYEVQSCDDLSQAVWSSVRSLVAGGWTLTTTESTGHSPQRFYRIVSGPPPP